MLRLLLAYIRDAYLVASDFALPRLEKLVDKPRLHVVAASGGKLVLANQPAGPV
jgi:hypothetical protein